MKYTASITLLVDSFDAASLQEAESKINSYLDLLATKLDGVSDHEIVWNDVDFTVSHLLEVQ